MRKMKWIGFIGLVAILVAGLLVISCAPKPAGLEKPIKIGALLGYTGPANDNGPKNEEGMKYYLDSIGWQVEGRKIEMVFEDSAGDVTISVDKAKKMVEQDGIVALIGPVISSCNFAVAAYLAPTQIPYLSIMDIPLDVLEHGNCYTPGGGQYIYSYLLGKYLVEEKGYKKFAFIYPDYVWGTNFRDGFLRAFRQTGAELVQPLPTEIFCLDFGPYLTAVKKEVDCLAYIAYTGNTPTLFKQYQQFGLKVPLVLAKGNVIPHSVTPELGDACLGVLTVEQYSAYIDNDKNREYVADFKAKKGYIPETYQFNAHQSLAAVVEAIKITNGDTTPAKLNWALKEKLDLTTPAGYKLSFDETGMATWDMSIMEMQKVQGDFGYGWIPIKTFKNATDRMVPES